MEVDLVAEQASNPGSVIWVDLEGYFGRVKSIFDDSKN